MIEIYSRWNLFWNFKPKKKVNILCQLWNLKKFFSLIYTGHKKTTPNHFFINTISPEVPLPHHLLKMRKYKLLTLLTKYQQQKIHQRKVCQQQKKSQ